LSTLITVVNNNKKSSVRVYISTKVLGNKVTEKGIEILIA
jgi:hypothetical protein